MSRAVQYGDFLSKALAYEHLVKSKKQTPEAAQRRITEMFVNYNLLPGRTRSYSEGMGLTWFWAFKIRAIKEAHRMMRDNPLRALLTTVGGGALPDVPGISIGSPITDNFLSVTNEGRLGYSVGPQMLFHAPALNPWLRVIH